MEQDELIAFVRASGYPDFTARQLKRFREEKVVAVQTEHSGFGGTTSTYSSEAAERVLAVCRLLKQQRGRNFNAVRFKLWLEGFPIEVGLLKESIWKLTPFSSEKEPATSHDRRKAARLLAQKLFNAAWKSVRTNFGRKVLQNFESSDDQQWFIGQTTQLLYGIPGDFRRDFLGEPASQGQLEEPADILAHGLQIRHIHSIPPDISEGLQEVSDQQLFSWMKMKATLFAATTEELELARERFEMADQLMECLEIMGYAGKLHRLARAAMKRPAIQAPLFCLLLVLEQNGYSHNLDVLNATVRTNLPIFKHMQEFHATLQRELPTTAREIPPLPVLGRLFVEGTQQERDAYLAHLQNVYQQNKEALDAFWRRHTELKEALTG